METIGIALAIIGGLGIGFSGWKATIFFYVMILGLYLAGYIVL